MRLLPPPPPALQVYSLAVGAPVRMVACGAAHTLVALATRGALPCAARPWPLCQAGPEAALGCAAVQQPRLL
jgi:hypothetical protein